MTEYRVFLILCKTASNKFVCVLCAQSCPTLCNPLDCSPPGSSVHGISQARILEWVAISYPKGSSRPRDQTSIACISCIGRWILHHCATWKASIKTSTLVFNISFIKVHAIVFNVRTIFSFWPVIICPFISSISYSVVWFTVVFFLPEHLGRSLKAIWNDLK